MLTAAGGSSKALSMPGKCKASLPLISVEGAGVGGNTVGGMMAIALT